MWPLVVIETNPVTNDPTGVLQTLKAVAVCTLLLERPDHPLDHPVLLWAVGRDELLLQPIAFDQGCVAAAREDQTVVRAKQERLGDPPQAYPSGDPILRDKRR